jgi:hypothetical protein
MPQGSYVTDETIGKVDDEVRSDETVQYIAKGNSLDAKYQGSTTSYNNTKGWPRAVATDQRVFFKVPKVLNTKVESVRYNELSAADIGSSGLSGTEMKLRTIQGKTFVFKADEPGEAELKEMIEFIRGQITGQPEPESNTSSTTNTTTSATTSSSSERADLHKTESCIECNEGVSEGVTRCPHCGYNPSDHKKWVYIHGLLCCTVILFPISFFKARAHGKKARKGVTG